jgi:hypothetical protein
MEEIQTPVPDQKAGREFRFPQPSWRQPVNWILYKASPRDESAEWNFLMWRLSRNKAKDMTFYVIALCVVMALFGNTRNDEITIYCVFGFIAFSLVLLTSLLQPVIRFPKELKSRDLAADFLSAPLRSSSFIYSFVRLFLTTMFVIYGMSLLLLLAIECAYGFDLYNRKFEGLFALYETTFCYLWVYYWSAIALKPFSYLPGLFFAAYIVSLFSYPLFGAYPSFFFTLNFQHMFSIFLFCIGILLFLFCKDRYLDRLRARVFP